MELKAGTQLKSAVGTTEVVVIRAPDAPGHPDLGGPAHGRAATTRRRPARSKPAARGRSCWASATSTRPASVEVLCTKPGDGALALDGEPLEVKSAKPLPSSD